jgi:hypothetical protein
MRPTAWESAIESRVLASLILSAVVGAVGLHIYPFPAENVFLTMIHDRRPGLYSSFTYAYATLWISTPFLALNVAFSLLYIFVARWSQPTVSKPLPPYPPPDRREHLFLILGEQHRRTSTRRAAEPGWLAIPERGLYTGMVIVGAIGSGKTSACLYPYMDQLLGYKPRDVARKVSALILEVKGDFCRHVRDILQRYGRGDDYVEVSLDSPYRYNPLHNDLDAYALAYGIATLMTNLFGRGKEPFWQQASTNLVKFVILLHQTLDDYVTLFQVYEHVINPDKLRARIAEGEVRFFSAYRRVIVHKRQYARTSALKAWPWHDHAREDCVWTAWSAEVAAAAKAANIPLEVEVTPPPAAEAHKAAQFEAVKRWFDDDWTRIEPKLRTSIVEGISVFLSLFDDNPRVKHTFCPPKDTYNPACNPQGIHGVPLPPIADLIEQGKVIALNFPVALNPGLARALGTMLKQDFQRAVLNRIQKINADPAGPWRSVAFVCDEYQAFATTGENEPSGDEKFFSMARQARCMPIVATQSISSLRSTLSGQSWRTLLQGLRTKVFLALSDDFSAQIGADLCGKAEQLKTGYTLTEAGQDARVSLLTARPAAHRATVSATKTYDLSLQYVFQPKAFAELQNGQAIVLPYDGFNPQPPTYCYLKPYYLDVQTSYFDHVAAGAV